MDRALVVKDLFIQSPSKTKIMQKINVRELAGKFHAYLNCVKSNNMEWKEKHRDSINAMLENLPSGSGIDAGTKFDWDKSTPERLIFTFGFHHLNENGYYDGWTEHKAIVTPSLYFGINVNITGRDRNGIKDYLSDLFNETFTH